MFNGKGTYYFSNGNIHEGEFYNGKKHGSGVFKTLNPGEVYFCIWKCNIIINQDDKMNGKGKYLNDEGDIYEGYWEDDLKVGKGSYKSKNGMILLGEWKNGEWVPDIPEEFQ
jgi:hypothetical protein